jgi:capsular polysaccharide biosynthesis protein
MKPSTVAPLSISLLHDVVLQPILHPGRGAKQTFGAHDRDGHFLADFYRPLVDRRCAIAPPAAPVLRCEERCVYGGTIVGHYGHFLLESLARCWAFDEEPDAPIVWTKLRLGNSHEAWSPWIDRIFTLLGIDPRRNRVIEQTTDFATLALPEPGFRYFRALHPALVARLQVVGPVPTAPAGRVWLSRTALPDGFSRIAGEEGLEALLREAGWTIVAPETLDVMDQAGLFHSAEVVAGFSTSAFHSVLLQKVPRARLRIFLRDTIPPTNYRLIADRLSLDQRFLTTPMTQLDERAARSSYALADPPAAFRALMESL